MAHESLLFPFLLLLHSPLEIDITTHHILDRLDRLDRLDTHDLFPPSLHCTGTSSAKYSVAKNTKPNVHLHLHFKY